MDRDRTNDVLLPIAATEEIEIESIKEDTSCAALKVVVCTARKISYCPCCHRPSGRIHSRYKRTVADLPVQGVPVVIELNTRRFVCAKRRCPRRIFTERLPKTLAPYARKTRQLTDVVRLLGFALGGEAGSRLARELGLATSASTLLRRIKDAVLPPIETEPRVIGIDDWAWKKGMRYGTVVLDLERRRVLDILPDREIDTVAEWLKIYPSVQVVSRDRSGGYAEAVRRGAPQAVQVADRFHLLVNLTSCVERALAKHTSDIRNAIKRVKGDMPHFQQRLREPSIEKAPKPLSKQQIISQADRQRRLDRYNSVKELRSRGATAKETASLLGMGLSTVTKFNRATEFPDRVKGWQTRKTRAYATRIPKLWEEGAQSVRKMYDALIAHGFHTSRGTVHRELQRLQTLGVIPQAGGRKLPLAEVDFTELVLSRTLTPRKAAWCLLRGDDAHSTPFEKAVIEHLIADVPEISLLKSIACEFARIIRERDAAAFDGWLTKAAATGLKGFANGLRRDLDAVQAALTLEWSNGQTEGQNNRLKFIKRSMYGRAGFELLRQRILYHAA